MPSREIEDAVPEIRDRWEEIKNDFISASPGKFLVLTCVYRSPEEQMELFKKGRVFGTDGKWRIQDKRKVVTNIDGYTLLGAHNYRPSRAIDVAVVDNQSGKYLWDAGYYKPLVAIAKQYGLESGGVWKTFQDWPHIQIKDYKSYALAVEKE